MNKSFLLFLATLGAASIGGCGGSSSGQTAMADARGNASVTINWPNLTRLIPADSESITISFKSGSTLVASKTVSRPSSGGTETVTFSSLPVGALTLTAQAFPTTDGSGVAQASASQPITIIEGESTPAELTMASTIAGFHVTPSSPTVAVGNSLALTASAYNSQDASVLTTASTISWTSSDPSVATITSAGVATGVMIGTTNLTVTDSESGVSSTFTLTVSASTGGVNVSVH